MLNHLDRFLRRPSPPLRLLGVTGAAAWLFALPLVLAVPADAQGNSRSGVTRYGTQPNGGHVGYRSHGHYRGAKQARPQAAPFLQSGGLSGIRPQGFGKFEPGAVQPPQVVHPAPHPQPRIIYVPIESYVPQRREPDPVIVVQQAPPPPQQPVVVMVPPPTPASPPPAAPVARTPVAPPAPPAPKEPGHLRISVLPSEATIYLDDRPVRDLGGEPRSLSAGVHVLEVSHPDFPDERLVFGMSSAGNMAIEIDLRETRSSRRTRLRDVAQAPDAAAPVTR